MTEPSLLPKGNATALAKSVIVKLVIDPVSITRVNSEGKKHIKMIVTIGALKLEASVNGKSYRKALESIDSMGVDNCTVSMQASMTGLGKLESCGIAVQMKAIPPGEKP